MKVFGILISLIAAVVLQCGCGGGSTTTSSSGSTPGGGTTSGGTTSGGGTTGGGGGSTGGSLLPAFTHAFIVLEENHSYSNVIGSSSMPYLNGLASANGLATQYYADAHPSLPNYFMLTVGAGTSINWQRRRFLQRGGHPGQCCAGNNGRPGKPGSATPSHCLGRLFRNR